MLNAHLSIFDENMLQNKILNLFHLIYLMNVYLYQLKSVFLNHYYDLFINNNNDYIIINFNIYNYLVLWLDYNYIIDYLIF
jgi:hypothetical protein